MIEQKTERTILANILYAPETLESFQAVGVTEETFEVTEYRVLWRALLRCSAVNRVTGGVDTFRLYESLSGEERRLWKGPASILLLVEGEPLVVDSALYEARKLIESRKALRLGRALSVAARSLLEGVPTDKVMQDLDLTLGRERGDLLEQPKKMTELVDRFFEAMSTEKNPVELRLGLRDMDQYLAGFLGSELLVIGARPGIGKTAFLTQLLVQSARAGTPSIFFSGEMGTLEIMTRIMSQQARIESRVLRTPGLLDERDIKHLMDAGEVIRPLGITMDEMRGRSIDELCSAARRLVRMTGAKIVAFDYLQLIGGDKESKKGGRYQEVSDVSRKLKLLATETRAVVVALAQLNRQIQGIADRKPEIGHLRDSGQIEQDADMIVLLSRADPKQPVTTVQVAKNRHGHTGELALEFDGVSTSFTRSVSTIQNDQSRVHWESMAQELGCESAEVF